MCISTPSDSPFLCGREKQSRWPRRFFFTARWTLTRWSTQGRQVLDIPDPLGCTCRAACVESDAPARTCCCEGNPQGVRGRVGYASPSRPETSGLEVSYPAAVLSHQSLQQYHRNGVCRVFAHMRSGRPTSQNDTRTRILATGGCGLPSRKLVHAFIPRKRTFTWHVYRLVPSEI